MAYFWNADLSTAQWAGFDLCFDAETDAGRVQYVVPAERLRDVHQRTGPEALASNLPTLRPVLIGLAQDARSGDTLILK